MSSRLAAVALCLAVVSTVGSGIAVAQSRPAGPKMLFISPCGQPYRAGVGETDPVTAWFAKTDLNADGALDRGEFRAEASGFFKVLDQDANGVISGPEVSRYEREIAPEVIGIFQNGAGPRPTGVILARLDDHDVPTYREGGFGGRLSGQTPRGKRSLIGAAPYGLLPDIQPVSGADLDLDGRITHEEFLKASDRRFARLDPKGTGRITLKDLPLTVEEERFKGRTRPSA